MAVDYFHRVIVSGPERDVRALRAGLMGEFVREIRGVEHRERLPFSFSGLFSLAPKARRIASPTAGPGEPYDIRMWPIVRASALRVEIRYQLHTRNAELAGFLRVLSRGCPRLTFRLSTHCLDDGEVVGFRMQGGSVRRWVLPPERDEFHWERARRKYRVVGEAAYDDDEARLFAEDGMRDEALDHWEPQARRVGARRRPRQWWNRQVARDLTTEREMVLLQVGQMWRAEQHQRTAGKRPSRGRKVVRERNRS